MIAGSGTGLPQTEYLFTQDIYKIPPENREDEDTPTITIQDSHFHFLTQDEEDLDVTESPGLKSKGC